MGRELFRACASLQKTDVYQLKLRHLCPRGFPALPWTASPTSFESRAARLAGIAAAGTDDESFPEQLRISRGAELLSLPGSKLGAGSGAVGEERTESPATRHGRFFMFEFLACLEPCREAGTSEATSLIHRWGARHRHPHEWWHGCFDGRASQDVRGPSWDRLHPRLRSLEHTGEATRNQCRTPRIPGFNERSGQRCGERSVKSSRAAKLQSLAVASLQGPRRPAGSSECPRVAVGWRFAFRDRLQRPGLSDRRGSVQNSVVLMS